MITGSPTAIIIYAKDKKNLHIFVSPQKDHIYILYCPLYVMWLTFYVHKYTHLRHVLHNYHFLLNYRLYIEYRTVLFIFLPHHNFWRYTRTLLFGDSEPLSPFYLSVIIYFFLYHECLYNYYPSCSLSDICFYDTGENLLFVVKLVFDPIVYI